MRGGNGGCSCTDLKAFKRGGPSPRRRKAPGRAHFTFSLEKVSLRRPAWVTCDAAHVAFLSVAHEAGCVSLAPLSPWRERPWPATRGQLHRRSGPKLRSHPRVRFSALLLPSSQLPHKGPHVFTFALRPPNDIAHPDRRPQAARRRVAHLVVTQEQNLCLAHLRVTRTPQSVYTAATSW